MGDSRTTRRATIAGALLAALALALPARAQSWPTRPILLCDQTTSTTQYIKAGYVKLYGVTTGARLKTLPDAPTLAEQALKGFEVVVWHGIYAPKGTPKEAIEKFGGAMKAALKDAGVAQRLAELGAVTLADAKQTPAGLQTWLQQEIARYGPVIKTAGQFAD